MKIYVDLKALTDDSPWTCKKVFGTVPTAGDYPAIVNYADPRDWFWSAIATPDFAHEKRRFHDQYSLGRNDLVIVDDFRDVAPALLISRDLNLCRLFCAAGGRAVWIDYPKYVDVSGTNTEFLAACAERWLAR